MPVLFAGNRIVPAPLVTIDKTFFRNDNGEKLGASFTFTLQGTVLPSKGAPFTDGSTYTDPSADPADQNVSRRPSGVMSKLAGIRDLFSLENGLLQIYACDPSDQQINAYVTVESINIPQDTWTQQGDYTIVLNATLVSGTLNGFFSVFPSGEDAYGPYLKSSSESWNIETSNAESDAKLRQHTFVVTHNVSAVGQRIYFPSGSNHLYGVITKEPHEWAKHYCESKLVSNPINQAFASGMTSGVLNWPSGYLNAYNHVRTISVDKTGGSYAVNDTWILSSGTAFEDFSVSVQQSADTGLTTIGVEGSIQGMEVINYLANTNNVTTTKWETASGLFNTVSGNLYTRANQYNGSLNAIPLASNIQRNPVEGTIAYSFTYNDRPANCITSPLVISEVIQIDAQNPLDIFSNIAIVGRTAGPLLQDMATTSAATRTLDIDVVYKPSGCVYGPPTNIIQSINSYIGSYSGSLGASQLFRFVDSENSMVKEGRYHRVIGWTLGNCS